MAAIAAFWLLGLLTLASPTRRRGVFRRRPLDWWLDLSGLFVQTVGIRLLQPLLVAAPLTWMYPHAAQSLEIPVAAAFLIHFVGLDYLYYWNHRALHTRRLWRVHAYHHATGHLDLFMTARNSLATPLFIVYIWVNGLLCFVLRNPEPIFWSIGLSGLLDSWHHTDFAPRPGSGLHRVLSRVWITPIEHAWHHSAELFGKNFGAVWSLWDRLHGTFHRADVWPERYGIEGVRVNLRGWWWFPKVEERP